MNLNIANKILLLMLFLPASLFASDDTLNVVILEEFQVPEVGALVVHPVIQVEFRAELYDDNGNYLRDCNYIGQKYTKQELFSILSRVNTGRINWRGGYNYAFVKDTISQPGNYIIKFTAIEKRESGNSKTEIFEYPIKVELPSLSSKISLKQTYYIGEKATFSFATNEYINPQLYSFRILNAGGDVVDSGSGPIVTLDTLLASQSNAGKRFRIEGFYKNKPFTYNDLSDNGLQKSTNWDFEINSPRLEVYTQWLNNDPENTGINKSFSIYDSKVPPIQFTYSRFTESTGEYVLIRPENLRILSVTTRPTDILTNLQVSPGGPFINISFDFSNSFGSRIRNGLIQEVFVQVMYQTPFAGTVTREFKAVIKN